MVGRVFTSGTIAFSALNGNDTWQHTSVELRAVLQHCCVCSRVTTTSADECRSCDQCHSLSFALVTVITCTWYECRCTAQMASKLSALQADS